MRLKLFIFSAALVLMGGCKALEKSQEPETGVSWSHHSRLTDAIDQAKAENKLVFIDFYTDWCTPCRMMDQDVFSDPVLGDFFNANFVNLKVNCEKKNGPNLAFLYQVQVYPVLLFVDENGRELVRKNGAAYHSELRAMAEEAISLGKSGS